MPPYKKLATLASAAAAARSYAKKNPEQASRWVDQAAQFIDKQTKGKYSSQISGVASKAKSAAGIHAPDARTQPFRADNSPYGSSYGQPGPTQYGTPQTGTPQPGTPQPGTSQYGSGQYGRPQPGPDQPGPAR
jgi:hypothetical protein